MAVFLDRPAQKYNARVNPYSVSATIPAGLANPVRWVSITLTPTGAWPDGPVGEVTLTRPDGGFQYFAFDGAYLFSRSPTRGCKFEYSEGDPFPAGAYTLAFKAIQDVDAALRIERG